MSEIQTGEGQQPEEYDGDLAIVEQLEQEEYGDLSEAMSSFDQASNEVLNQTASVSTDGFNSEDIEAIRMTVLAMAHAFKRVSTLIFASEPDAEKAATLIVDIMLDNEKARVELFRQLKEGVSFGLCDRDNLIGAYIDQCQSVDKEQYPELAQAFFLQSAQADINTLLNNSEKKAENEEITVPERRFAKAKEIAIEVGKMAAAATLALAVARLTRPHRSR